MILKVIDTKTQRIIYFDKILKAQIKVKCYETKDRDDPRYIFKEDEKGKYFQDLTFHFYNQNGEVEEDIVSIPIDDWDAYLLTDKGETIERLKPWAIGY